MTEPAQPTLEDATATVQADSRKAPYLSFSRLSLYAGCPARYKLRYVDKLARRPNLAGLGGGAVHEVIAEAEQEVAWADEDAWEDPGPWANRFRQVFDEKLEEAGGEEACYIGGRSSKQWPDGETAPWWRHKGPIFLHRYAALRRRDEEAGLVIPQGGVEMEVGVTLSDGMTVKGYVDGIPMVDTATGIAIVRDYKTGTWLDPLQLLSYAWMIRETRGWTITTGEFAKLRAEDPEDILLQYDLTPWLEDGVAPERYEALAAQLQISQERDLWPVNPSNLCVACDVKDACSWGKRVEKR